MARSRKASDALPLDKLMRHHRAAWRVERIAWAVIALSLLAAVLGVFGDGPLSSTRAGESTSLSVEYERLLRSAAPTEYRFDASRIVISDGTLRLRFDQALIDDIEIDTVVPAVSYTHLTLPTILLV